MQRLLRLFNPELPAKVWLLQLGVFINFLGNGMVAPFLVIYLHFGRGIPLGLAGSAVALGGITAVTSGLVAGSLADRVGPRNILVVAMISNAAAYLLYTQVTVPWQAFAVGLMVGFGTGSYGPSSQNLIASLVAADKRQAAFAQNRVTSVVGLGAGGAIGGVIASAGLSGYLHLLVLDSVTFLSFAALMLLLPSTRAATRAASNGGYVAVMRDRAFLWLVAVNTAMVAAGIAPMLVLLPAFAKIQTHTGESAIGAIYALNTLTIVAAQLPITKLTAALPRMLILRGAAGTWIVSWLVCLAAGASLRAGAAIVVIAMAVVVYALGECLYSSVMLPTAIALAPAELRGRYLGAMGLAWQSGFLIGPSAGSAILAVAPLALPAFCAVVCLAAALGTRLVERNLSPTLRKSAMAVAQT
jgi:MFS family permease